MLSPHAEAGHHPAHQKRHHSKKTLNGHAAPQPYAEPHDDVHAESAPHQRRHHSRKVN